ncbi:MAG: cyclase family protein [Methanotrichaceae archaeon]|nr:cyclase family protein [Methanotrichaceae archaeon]
MIRFFDVSIPIHEEMIVYPGNPKPSIRRYAQIPEDVTNESVVTFGCHTGSHVDSRLHISNEGSSAEALPLDSFFGKCKVLDLTHVEKEIHKEDLEGREISEKNIILIKTKNSLSGYRNFNKDFVHIKMDAAKYLVEMGVKTLGFDYLSVKKFGGDDDVHEMLINNLTLFEGLDLSKVPEGEYMFLGLPLRMNTDGAPARVILVEHQGD